MARSPEDTPLVPTVMDRLMGLVDKRGAAYGDAMTVEEMKASVQRDLENLLNTRWRVSAWPPTLEELERSVINYGIPDFSGSSLTSAADREEFRRILENAIRVHEPRFLKVRVTIDQDKAVERTLHFKIDAELRTHPNPEPVIFDSSVEPLSHRICVKSETR
ncbi:MAG: type VI secretion system protein ImpF [Pirellulaceae bacterium]|jgi:type VI secretion system protein ImpF